MPEAKDISPVPRSSMFLLLGAAMVRFVNLGFLDMQAWDEAVYAVRAETVAKFGLIVDQTARAVDGLYSSFHPPLYIWLTALSYEIFGISEFSARFFSAVFGALTLFVIHRIGVLLRSERVGLVAALFYGLAPIVLFYSRQGQLDVTFVFFMTLSMYFTIRAFTESSHRYPLYAGISIGLALMSKALVGLFIPLAILIWIVASREYRSVRMWAVFGILSIGTFIVAAPWHFYMTLVHGDGNPLFFLGASDVLERAFGAFEGNVKPLGILYYFNQLFVVFPFAAVWMLAALPSAFKRSDPMWMLVGTWFVVFFVAFSLMSTQLQVYILPALVPIALLGSRSIVRAVSGQMKRKAAIVLFTGSALSTVWALSQDWRNAVKGALARFADLDLPATSDLEMLMHLALGVAIVLSIGTLLWNRASVRQLSRLLIPIHVAPLIVYSLYSVVVVDQDRYVDGATELTRFISERNIRHLVVAGYERNPQLSYYLAGSDLGWPSAITFKRIVPPRKESEFKDWLAAELLDVDSRTLVVLEKDKFIRYNWIRPQLLMPQSFVPVFESRRYSAWMRRPDDTLARLGERKRHSERFIP